MSGIMGHDEWHDEAWWGFDGDSRNSVGIDGCEKCLERAEVSAMIRRKAFRENYASQNQKIKTLLMLHNFTAIHKYITTSSPTVV